MTQTESETDVLDRGLTRDQIAALLADAEPRRLATLSCSLNLTIGIILMMAGDALWRGDLLWGSMAVIVGLVFWRLSERLWRDQAIAVVAPAIGAAWGQTRFASGWTAMPLEERLAGLFGPEGMHFLAWTSEGNHRDIAYRLSETTIWRRRIGNMPRQIDHVMAVEIRVPQPFSGRVELTPSAGLMGRVDGMLRQVSGSAEQRRDIDPVFDAQFDTLASADAPVDQLLTPAFRRAMLALAARHPRVYLTARFERGWFHLRLPIPHLSFASASLLTPMSALVEDADTLWWDLTVPHRLIDGLMGDHDGPLR